jgi:hypothetical protein
MLWHNFKVLHPHNFYIAIRNISSLAAAAAALQNLAGFASIRNIIKSAQTQFLFIKYC